MDFRLKGGRMCRRLSGLRRPSVPECPTAEEVQVWVQVIIQSSVRTEPSQTHRVVCRVCRFLLWQNGCYFSDCFCEVYHRREGGVWERVYHSRP